MEEHKEFPNFWSAVLILALLIGVQIILGIIAYDLGLRYERGDPGTAGIITVISCGIVFALLMSYKKIGYREIFNQTSISVSSFILVLIIPLSFTLGGAVFWINDITNLMLVYFPAEESEYLALTRLLSGGIVSVISVCIIAPFIEEMLFRGIILRSFLENYSVSSSIVLSSLLFALFHLTISQLPVAFIAGCLFAWLYVKTRSLWPSILAHFLYNSFVMVLWSTYAPDVQKSSYSPEFNSPGVIIVALASSTIGIIMLVKILKPTSGQRL